MSEQMGIPERDGSAAFEAQVRLRAHVESVLSNSSIPMSDRADVAEELYGHLWERWRAECSTETDEVAAAETAIRSFGQATPLGRQMTGAYHSMLYATTIGVLLPAVLAPSDRPSGLGFLRLAVALSAAASVVLVAVSLASLTPVRALVVALVLGVNAVIALVAFRALARAQKWALRYAQFVLATMLVEGAAYMFAAPAGGFNLSLSGLFAALLLPAAIGPAMARWVSGSKALSRTLTALLVTAVGLGALLPRVGAAVPDPTQVGSDNLHLQVSAACTRNAEGGVTDIDVTVQFRWDRLDLFPYGFLGGRHEYDQSRYDGLLPMISNSGGASAGEMRTTWVEPTLGDDQSHYEDLDDYATVAGPDGPITSMPAGIAPMLQTGSPGVVQRDGRIFDDGTLQAGWTYVQHVHYGWWKLGTSPGADPLVIVRYSHIDRFVVQALASCEGAGSGVVLPRPYPPTVQ
jgi:hypothetical protein